MSVSEKTGNKFPGTSQLSKFYIKRRFADKEVYEKYLSDIEALLEINKPTTEEYVIPEDKKQLLDERVATLEEKLEEVSSLYALSDELNYKNAEKEVTELNKILDQYLADIREEVSDLQYLSAEYYAKQKIIEFYKSNFKKYSDLYSDNKKMLLEDGAILILGKDGILYGCGDNKNNYLGDGNLEYHSYLTKMEIENEKIKDFEIYNSEVYCLTESGKIYISSFSNEGYIRDSDTEDLYYKNIIGYSKEYGILFLTFDEENEIPYIVYRGSNDNYTHEDDGLRYRKLDTNGENSFVEKIVQGKLGERCIVLFPNKLNCYEIGFIGKNSTGQFGTSNYNKSVEDWHFAIVSPGVEAENYTSEEQEKTGTRIIIDNSIFDFGEGTSYALDSDHNLYVTGSNKFGELGINSDEEYINKWTKVEEFDKNVQGVYSTNQKGLLTTIRGVYDYSDFEENEYRNETEKENDNSIWVCGKNLPEDPIYGLPTINELILLKTTLDSVNLGRFDNLEDYTVTAEQQNEINRLLADFAVLYEKVTKTINLYSSKKIKKWLRLYPGEDTNYLIFSHYTEIENLIERAAILYSEITEEIFDDSPSE